MLAFIGGKTGGPTRRASEAHVSTCGDCRALVSELARKSGASGDHVELAHAATVPSPPAARGSPPVLPGRSSATRYEVEWPIGAGGMGVVVAARHIELDQLVAIKFVRDEAIASEDAVQRFLREARAAVKLGASTWRACSTWASSSRARRTWSWSTSRGATSGRC